MTLTDDVILTAVEVTKLFPGTIALDHVNYQVYRGKVNALVGENGAGKSTLMNVLAGALQPTTGHIALAGSRVTLHSPREAARLGIGIIHQELNLFPNLSVVDNIFAGRELPDRWGGVDFAAEKQIALKLLAQLEQDDIDPAALVENLRVGQQQLVEIAKALAQDVRILIMDEPTSALSVSESKVLFEIIEDLKARGVSIIYISHKLEEVLAIADYITVLRDGQLVAEAPARTVDVNWIIQNMVGRHPDTFYQHQDHDIGKTVLEVKHFTLPHPVLKDRFLLDDISLELRAGEILGIYGLMGAGRTELLECLAGRCPEVKGEMWLDGRELSRCSIGERIELGVVLIPEDRQRDGIVQTLSVAHNMTLASLRVYFQGLVMSLFRERSSVREMIEKLSILVADPEQLITSLSGGNQQKVIVAKALLTEPRILLMDEPTRGIDVGAKSEIFRIMSSLATGGYGILFVSSELSEVLSLSDRIIVIAKGQISAELSRPEATEEALVAASAADQRLNESEENRSNGRE